jgi:hypothetical protein
MNLFRVVHKYFLKNTNTTFNVQFIYFLTIKGGVWPNDTDMADSSLKYANSYVWCHRL